MFEYNPPPTSSRRGSPARPRMKSGMIYGSLSRPRSQALQQHHVAGQGKSMMTGLQLRIAAGAAIAVIAGCAQQPVRAGSSAPASRAAVAPAASAAAQAAPAGLTPELLGLARDAGYHPSVVNGNTVFCRREVPVGSNLPVRQCVDATRLRLEVLQEQQEQARLNQHPTIGNIPGK